MDCFITYALAIFALLHVVLGVVEEPSALKFQVNEQPVDEAFLMLKVIERRTLHIYCFSSPDMLYFKWLKTGDPFFIVYSPNMSIPSIQLQTAGDYECLASPTTEFTNGETKVRSLTIDVLYPPAVPVIEGPYSILEGGTFNLTCSVKSNPPSTYVWSRESSIFDKHILSRGPLYVDPSYVNDQALFCFAEHNMFPTFGSSVSTITSSLKQVEKATPAVICFLQANLTVSVGNTLDLTCNTNGIPAPIIWWTKQGDDQFIYNGQRFIVNNIQTNFTGHYSCWAENTINPTGSKKRLTTVYQTIYISIVDKSIPDECQTIYQNAVLQGSSALTQDITTLPTNLNSSPIQDSKTKTSENQKSCNTTNTRVVKLLTKSNTGLVVVCVLGWICAICSVIALFILCIKLRKGRQRVPILNRITTIHGLNLNRVEENARNTRVEMQHNDFASQSNTDRALPTIPKKSASVKSTYDEYQELEPDRDYNNPDYLNMKGKKISFIKAEPADSDMISNIDYNSKAVDSIDISNDGYLTPRSRVLEESGI